SSALDRPRADQCWSNAAQARRAPTRDRELPRSAEPDGRPALRPRGRTHRTADPAHPCSAPSSKLSVDGRFTSTESRFALLLKTVLQQNPPKEDVWCQAIIPVPSAGWRLLAQPCRSRMGHTEEYLPVSDPCRLVRPQVRGDVQ